MNGFGASIVYVLAGHSGVYVCWQGETRPKEDVWHGSESTGTPASCVVVHICSGWDEAEIPDPASVSWVCVHVACDVV